MRRCTPATEARVALKVARGAATATLVCAALLALAGCAGSGSPGPASSPRERAGTDAVAPPTVLNAPGDRAYEVSAAWIGRRPALAWYGGRQAREAVFLRYVDLQGRPDGPELQLTDARRDAFEPSLQALDADPVLAWYEEDDTGHQVALLARFDAGGKRRWLRELSGPQADGRNPVVRTGAGRLHVAWIEYPRRRQGADAPVLRVATLDGDGRWLEPARTVGRVSRDTWNLNAALQADTFEVVYDSSHDTRAKELHSIRVRGARVQAALLSADDGHDSVYPDIAVDGDRRVLAWFDYRDGNAEVYLRCDGGPERRVTGTGGESIGAYVTWHAGRVELAWTDAAAGSASLWARSFDPTCGSPGVASRLSSGTGLAGIPSWAASPRGLALGWNERQGDARTLALHGHNHAVRSEALFRLWPPGSRDIP